VLHLVKRCYNFRRIKINDFNFDLERKNQAKFTMEFTAEEFEKAIVEAYQATKGKTR
jgi:hypothetical protein